MLIDSFRRARQVYFSFFLKKTNRFQFSAGHHVASELFNLLVIAGYVQRLKARQSDCTYKMARWAVITRLTKERNAIAGPLVHGLLKLSFSPLNLLKKNKSLLQKNKKNKSRPSCFARQQKRPIYTECECFHVRLRDDIHYANFLGSIMLRAQPNDSKHKDGIYIVLTSHWYLMTWR